MTDPSPDQMPMSWQSPDPLPHRPRPAQAGSGDSDLRGAPALPRRGDPPLPQRGDPALPRRGDPGGPPPPPGQSLPRRTTNVRRRGRHRSAHRISVSSDAPALVLAATAQAMTRSPNGYSLAETIALAAGESCPGAAIRVGCLDDGPDSLAVLLASAPQQDQDAMPAAVVVPLLAGPNPVLDQQIEVVLRRSPAHVLLASHLGPHPLLAQALHDRLAEVGLARAARARGINIAAGADGVLMVADRGPQALTDAGVTAVLLAARLAVPTAPAVLDDPASIDSALARLAEAGSAHPAIAPCVLGPESDLNEFDRLAAALGAQRSAPLGDHPAIAQLVAVRYGEALSRISLPSH